MNYPNGEKIEVDDLVTAEDIEKPGKIMPIVETEDDIILWECVEESGVFIECEIFGCLFLPEQLFGDSKLEPYVK